MPSPAEGTLPALPALPATARRAPRRSDAAPGQAPEPGPIPGYGDEAAPERGEGQARSLFGEILDWMFAPLLLLWPMSVTLTYLVAHSIASGPYDQALVERAQTLAAHLRFEGGRARFDLSPGLLEMYGSGVGEAGTYVVADAQGRVLAGDPDLPRPRGPSAGPFQLRDDTLRGHPVRIAYAWVDASPSGGALAGAHAGAYAGADSGAVLIEAAEPPTERTQLANEIVKGVILPQFVVLPLALLLVWFGLSRGLAPLARLQQTIRHRPPHDLSPISAEAAPEELTPLLGSFNDLLDRMTHNLDVQKRFIADAAHQMKTPLAGLRTQAELAQREADPVELQRSLRQIAASTERATRLVNQLLALARAEHGAGDRIARVPVDLDALARSVVQEWVAPALARGIDLGYEGPPFSGAGGGCIVHGTPVLLQELLTNLIDNALRYGVPAAAEADASAHARGRGRGRGQGVVTVRVEHDGAGKVRLDVEDDGPGIAAEERAHIFDRFYRVLGNRQDGSGLGLAIVREIALQHGAIVEVGDTHAPPEPGREAQGRGSRFRVTFGAAAA